MCDGQYPSSHHELCDCRKPTPKDTTVAVKDPRVTCDTPVKVGMPDRIRCVVKKGMLGENEILFVDLIKSSEVTDRWFPKETTVWKWRGCVILKDSVFPKEVSSNGAGSVLKYRLEFMYDDPENQWTYHFSGFVYIDSFRYDLTPETLYKADLLPIIGTGTPEMERWRGAVV